MHDEEILDKQIENYIHHRMTVAEQIAFEKSLLSDPDLKKQVFELLELKSLYNKELFELKKQLDKAENNLKENNFFDESREV